MPEDDEKEFIVRYSERGLAKLRHEYGTVDNKVALNKALRLAILLSNIGGINHRILVGSADGSIQPLEVDLHAPVEFHAR